MKTTEVAHYLLEPYIHPGDCVIDATMGNGHDTLRLALLSVAGRGIGSVYSFDVDQTAIERTKDLLKANNIAFKNITNAEQVSGAGVYLIHESHEQINKFVQQDVSAAIFNLGYLPGKDKSKTTMVQTTIAALDATLSALKVDGAAVVVMYGHEEGVAERKALLSFAAELDASAYHCAHMEMINQQKSAPSILMLTKKKVTYLND